MQNEDVLIKRVIDWSLHNRLLVLIFSLILALAGIYALRDMTVDAIPDLSDAQVIVKTSYPGQSPDLSLIHI